MHFVKHLKIKELETNQEYEWILDIRKKVFIKEQKVPSEIEIDEYEKEATYFIAYFNKEPVGCARIRFNNYAKLERIAVVKKHRMNGFGTKITKHLINYCKRKNISDIRIHSQSYIANFYEKIGFKKISEEFYEAGIKHVEMVYQKP